MLERFKAVENLYGPQQLDALAHSHVTVAGVGGVGSWCAEALARTAVGQITLIDFDHVSVGNTNRQIQALDPEYGRSKISVLAQRLQAINPKLKINLLDTFVEPENIDSLLPKTALVDATDATDSKVAMAEWSVKNKVPFVMCGSAGGKTHPEQIRLDDLAKTVQDPLLARVRYRLRKDSTNTKKSVKLGVRSVYSMQPRCMTAQGGLECSGYGSVLTVTAVFGFFAAADIIQQILCSK